VIYTLWVVVEGMTGVSLSVGNWLDLLEQRLVEEFLAGWSWWLAVWIIDQDMKRFLLLLNNCWTGWILLLLCLNLNQIYWLSLNLLLIGNLLLWLRYMTWIWKTQLACWPSTDLGVKPYWDLGVGIQKDPVLAHTLDQTVNSLEVWYWCTALLDLRWSVGRRCVRVGIRCLFIRCVISRTSLRSLWKRTEVSWTSHWFCVSSRRKWVIVSIWSCCCCWRLWIRAVSCFIV
jgi:hypothetical protein